MSRAKLASNRSPNWAIWQKFEVPNYDGPGNYLTRLRVVQCSLFGVYVHRFDGPDPRATLHDHPWPWVSIVLRGSYTERRLNPQTMEVNEWRKVRRINVMPLGGAHAIVSLGRTPTWTLMLVGRRRRVWGYWEPRGNAWCWTQFDKHPHNQAFLAALERREGNGKHHT